MKYVLDADRPAPIALECINVDINDVVATEDGASFISKLITKIGTFFGMQAAYAKYIKNNLKVFDDLNPEKVVRTVLAKDLSIVAAAIRHINEGLEKLRLGGKLDLVEFCGQELEVVGIEIDRGRLSAVKFSSGNWGEGKDKTGIDSPMTYSKTIEEHGWLKGARNYAENFIELAKETTTKRKLIDASNRHWNDVKSAHARGLMRNQANFDKKIAIDQINQINAARHMLLKFYFKQLQAILKGANIQPIGEVPAELRLPNNYVGK